MDTVQVATFIGTSIPKSIWWAFDRTTSPNFLELPGNVVPVITSKKSGFIMRSSGKPVDPRMLTEVFFDRLKKKR